MKDFKNSHAAQYTKLLQFPAYFSLLAGNVNGYLDNAEKHAAIELTHIKTFVGDPLLIEFFKDVEACLVENIKNLDYNLPIGKNPRDKSIKDGLAKLEETLLLLDEPHAAAMHRSMRSFKQHVSEAHHNVLVDFLFPISIKGLSY